MVVLPGMALVGLAVLHAVVTPALKLAPANQALLLIGFSLVLQNLALFLFSPDFRIVTSSFTLAKVTVGPLVVSGARLIAFVVAVLIAAGLYLFMRGTDLGRALRAVAQDGEAAALTGINVRRVYLVAFALSAACLGVAAPLVMPFQAYVAPTVGTAYVLIAFVIVIVGGLGNFWGTLVASLLVGVTEALGSVLLPGSLGPVLPYTLLLVILFIRPEGLLGKRA